MNKEIRSIRGDIGVSDDGNTLFGYAAVYNSLSGDLGGFREMLKPGCFDAILASNPDVRGLKNHDTDGILGRTASGTMTLSVDDRGLRYEISLPDTQLARDLKVEMKRGDIDGSSFSFTVDDEGQDWISDGNGGVVREIRTVSGLFDVGPVVFPAYEDSTAAVRSYEQMKQTADKEAQDKAEQKSKAQLALYEKIQRQAELGA